MRLLAALSFVLVVQPLLGAAPDCIGIALFDFRSSQGKNRTFFFPSDADYASDDARTTYTDAGRVVSDPTNQDKLATLVDEISSGAAAKATRDRVITIKGDTVCGVAVFDRGSEPVINFAETPRPTRFEQDLSTLKKIVKGPGAAPAKAVVAKYQLVQLRGTLTITAKQMQSAATASPATPAPSGNAETQEPHTASPENASTGNPTQTSKPATGESKDDTLTIAVTTGPAEHLFVGLDVPATKTQKFKVSQQSVDVKDKPTDYYASLSWQLGDLFSEFPTRYDKNVVIKGFMNLSRDPRSSYGVGVGYRLPPISHSGFELKDVSPFAGYFRSTATTSDTKTDVHMSSWRFGISFNLDKALTWASSAKQ